MQIFKRPALYLHIFTLKAPDSGHVEGVLARADTWTLDGLRCMSAEGTEQLAFIYGDVAVRRHVSLLLYCHTLRR